ncbi:hypothetical protein ACFL6G_03275 [candidate division KSB1 bacterium]
MDNGIYFLSKVIIPAVLVLAVAAVIVTKILADARIKQKLIEKGVFDEKHRDMFLKKKRKNPVVYLKWLLLAWALCIPLMGRGMFPGFMSADMTVIVLLILPTAAIMIYYFIAKKEYEKEQEESRETEDV